MPKISTEIRAMSISGVVTGKKATHFNLNIKIGTNVYPLELHDLQNINSPHSSGGIIELTDGWYRVDLPDEFFTTTPYRVALFGSVVDGHVVSGVVHSISDATNQQIIEEIQKLNLVPVSSLDQSGEASNNTLLIHRGDTLIRMFSGLGNLLNIQNIIITGKQNKEILDENSIFKVSLIDNLIISNGSSPLNKDNGTIAIVNEGSGIASLYISEKESANFIDIEDGHFDVQLHYEGSVVTKIDGILIITADVTREI